VSTLESLTYSQPKLDAAGAYRSRMTRQCHHRDFDDSHAIPRDGPVASQEAIKMLGTNGGGFFNANPRTLSKTRHP